MLELAETLRVRDLFVPLGNAVQKLLTPLLLFCFCCSGGGVQTLSFAAAAKFISAAELVCLARCGCCGCCAQAASWV